MNKEGEKTNLTLGDLLEEGYAFKYENDTWVNDSHVQTSDGLSVTVEKAPIQSVAVFAKDKNNNEVSTNMAYGTTGEVTLVSSCQMGETSGADLTYLWYKLEGLRRQHRWKGQLARITHCPTISPRERTPISSSAPATAIPRARRSPTVTPISLEDAEVTVQSRAYNGSYRSRKSRSSLGR